jgi:predicted nucleic acid-binding protein
LRYNTVMHKLKIYIDTSVFNFALTDKPELILQKRSTLDLFSAIKDGRYEAFISDAVTAEINNAPQDIAVKLRDKVKEISPEKLTLNEEAEKLAGQYISQGIIPAKYENDAFHIAIATVNDLDIIVSWNFKHIVKLKTKHGVIAINALLNYKAIEIVSPLEVT